MKKNFLRSLLCLIMCFVTAIAFCACTPTDSGDDTDPDKNKWWSTEGELQKDAEGNVIFNNVSIKLDTVVAGDDKDAFNQLVTRFNREYQGKIRVTVNNIAAGDYENSVSTKIHNNSNPPDLLMSHQKSHKNFADNKIIQPLNEAMEASGITFNASDYAVGLAKYMSAGYENYTFSVPADAQSQVSFYNKKLLAELGKELPTNRAELLDVCKAFKDKYGRAAIAWTTGGDYFSNYVYLSAVLQNGAALYNESTLMAEWYDNEAYRVAISNASESFRELFRLGYANFAESSSSALQGFLNGQRLFYFTDPWSMTDLVTTMVSQQKLDSEEELFETVLGGNSYTGWFAMTDNPNKNAVYGDSHFFAMARTVTDINKKAAILEFIKWFTTNAEAGAEWAKAGHISASNAITSNTKYSQSAYVVNFISKFYGSIDNFHCVGATPHYAAITDNLRATFADTVDAQDNHTRDRDYSTIKQKQDAANNSISFFG